MTRDEPFRATFRWDKETKNTVRYAEESADRRPALGVVYVSKLELPRPHPRRIRLTIEPTD